MFIFGFIDQKLESDLHRRQSMARAKKATEAAATPAVNASGDASASAGKGFVCRWANKVSWCNCVVVRRAWFRRENCGVLISFGKGISYESLSYLSVWCSLLFLTDLHHNCFASYISSCMLLVNYLMILMPPIMDVWQYIYYFPFSHCIWLWLSNKLVLTFS